MKLPEIAKSYREVLDEAARKGSSMLEVLKQDYIKTARAAGIPERTVIFRYALRNALLPVVTVIGLSVGGLLSGRTKGAKIAPILPDGGKDPGTPFEANPTVGDLSFAWIVSGLRPLQSPK